MIFKAKNLSVEIVDDKGKTHTLPVYDARNPFHSFELDQARTKADDTHKQYLKLSEEIEGKKEPDEKDIKSLEIIYSELIKLNYEFLKLNIRNFENHVFLLREINSQDMVEFSNKIRMASFGISESDEIDSKKKDHLPRITSKGLKGGGTRKRK